jgi:MinD-like ATPase involved in chromosome partitioning or flagellar assembly
VEIVDVGPGSSQRTARVWESADLVLLVTTPTQRAILDAYATIKAIRDVILPKALPDILTVVNDCRPSDPQSPSPHDRLRATCGRFLGVELAEGATIPYDRATWAADGSACVSPTAGRSTSAACRKLAERVRARLADRMVCGRATPLVAG